MSLDDEKRSWRGSNRPPLPRPVQEHLGRKLRAQLYETGERPQYLGDPVVPREFDPLIEKIQMNDRVRRATRIRLAGQQAVAVALAEFRKEGAAVLRTEP